MKPKWYRVTVNASAVLVGVVKVEARSEEEARRKAMQSPVKWEYDGEGPISGTEEVVEALEE
jgi:hypothetical protein